jgi:hypothetical protein
MPELNVWGNPKKNQWRVSDRVQNEAEQKQMMLNTDLCMIFDDSWDSVNCDKCILNHPDFMALPSGAEKMHTFNFCNNIRGQGHFLNAKERLCCVWTRPDKMMIGSQWYKEDDPVFPLPALYNSSRSDNHHCGVDFQMGQNAEFGRECCRKVFDHPDSIAQGGYAHHDFCDYQGNIEAPAWRYVQEFAYDENVWHEGLLDAWGKATTNSIGYIFSAGGEDASRAHWEISKENCGCCRQKGSVDGDESFEECEHMKNEDTYSESFWSERQKTYPYWTAEGDADRDNIVTKLENYLVSKGADVSWMGGMDGSDPADEAKCPR